jgi:hypothetical protein
MNKETLQHYIQDQLAEIMKYKWIESEKAGKDIGADRAAMEWIDKYSDSYREYWRGLHGFN